MRYKKFLFVCSGNMCRSPMAEAIFRDMIAKDEELQSLGIEVRSAGTLSYVDSAQASHEAIEVMKDHGIDLSRHEAKHVKAKLIDWSDIILVMKPEHKAYIISQFPRANSKVFLLNEFVGEIGHVEDPIGQGIEAYRSCVNQLLSLLNSLKIKIKQQES